MVVIVFTTKESVVGDVALGEVDVVVGILYVLGGGKNGNSRSNVKIQMSGLSVARKAGRWKN